MNRLLEPNWEKSALITIDTQNDFSMPGAVAEIKGTYEILGNIAKIVATFRERQLPIIHVVRLYREDGANVDLCRREYIKSGNKIVTPGSQGAELVDEIKAGILPNLESDELLAGSFQKVCHNEWVMYKPRWGAFYQTNLDSFLRGMDINTLVFCGCNFPNCPRATIYQASERDFKIVAIKDGISAIYEQGIAELANIGVKIMSTKELNTA